MKRDIYHNYAYEACIMSSIFSVGIPECSEVIFNHHHKQVEQIEKKFKEQQETLIPKGITGLIIPFVQGIIMGTTSVTT